MTFLGRVGQMNPKCSPLARIPFLRFICLGCLHSAMRHYERKARSGPDKNPRPAVVPSGTLHSRRALRGRNCCPSDRGHRWGAGGVSPRARSNSARYMPINRPGLPGSRRRGTYGSRQHHLESRLAGRRGATQNSSSGGCGPGTIPAMSGSSPGVLSARSSRRSRRSTRCAAFATCRAFRAASLALFCTDGRFCPNNSSQSA